MLGQTQVIITTEIKQLSIIDYNLRACALLNQRGITIETLISKL
jgi:hypothetical protein